MYKFKYTIFTPTYNRAHTLKKLYESLLKQSIKDFEWVIVDDGSTDTTKELINKFINEKLIHIRYIKQENSGKHVATNKGSINANGELFLIVDSDDRLVENALEQMLTIWESIERKDEYCGVTGLCIHEDRSVVGDKFYDDITDTNFIDIHNKLKIRGDKAGFITTKIANEFLFPEGKDIKFVTESVVLHKIAKKYKCRCVNVPIKVVEYLEDGLTRNNLNPMLLEGMAFSYVNIINDNIYTCGDNFTLWAKQYPLLLKHSLMIKKSYFKEIKSIKNKLNYILLSPIGLLLYIKTLINNKE